MTTGKVIIISAPSGCGKSTIINALMNEGGINMQFSVSATNRAPRGSEQDGVDYHFCRTTIFAKPLPEMRFLNTRKSIRGASTAL